MKFYEWLRTSEFWIAIVVGIGSALVTLGVISEKDWQVIFPYIQGAVVYIVARLTSKAVKKLF